MNHTKPNQTPEDALEFILQNPNLGARKIMKMGYDDVSTSELIQRARWYMAVRLASESLEAFNVELKLQGWEG